MAKIYLTGDYSEDGGTYALQIIADLLISKGYNLHNIEYLVLKRKKNLIQVGRL